MSYNLVSLMRLLEQILHPDQQLFILDHKKTQIASLLEKVTSLKQIIENSSPASSRSTKTLESQIRDAAHQAEDIIESHIVDLMLSKPGGKTFIISPPDLQKVIKEFDSALDKMVTIKYGNQMPNSSLPGVPLLPDRSSKNIVVGFDEDLIQLKERLTGHQTKLQTIPIVGMGGIGLLGCIIGKLTDKMLEEDNDELADILYKSLCGKRYLIVLDDMWSINAWDDIKRFFPNGNHRSRIILTTRESNVAEYADSSSMQHQMHLLNNFDSWNLLCEMVFGKENCPPPLEEIGQKIASNCRGLPLAIHVMGGLLSEARRTKDFWEHVSNDVSSAVAEKDETFSKIFSLSYDHLPYHLKPCFLYMGAFPEDCEIRASKLKRLWVAEGFLKPIEDKSLEEVAEVYLKALVDRNLLLVRHQESNDKAKSYSIHDLLRDLCVRKAGEERFLYVKNWQVHNVPEDAFHSLRRVSVHPSHCIEDIYASIEHMPLARSFLCTGIESHVILSPVFFALRLLRVLDVLEIEYGQFPAEILQLVNLRYLALSCNSTIPSGISRLQNLQTLIVLPIYHIMDEFYIPSEIWEMPQLRHVKFKRSVRVDHGYVLNFVLEKLQSFSYILVNDLIESNFLENTPNLKKLGISCFSWPPSVVDLHHLRKLEALKCFSKRLPKTRTFLSRVSFPPLIKKLTLSRCTIPWRFMTTVGLLSNLQVLKLHYCTFEGQVMHSTGAEWEPTEGEFCSLQFLLLDSLNLVHWRADETHFPRLRSLVIRYCAELDEIPRAIGEIPTLEIIELDESSLSAAASARHIQEEQRDCGNYGLEVRIYASW